MLADFLTSDISFSKCLCCGGFFQAMQGFHPCLVLLARFFEMLWNAAGNAALSGTPSAEGEASIDVLDLNILAVCKDTVSIPILVGHHFLQAVIVILAIIWGLEKEVQNLGLVHGSVASEARELLEWILHEVGL